MLLAVANLLGLAYGVVWILCTWLMEVYSEDMPGALEAVAGVPLAKAALMHHFRCALAPSLM